MISISETYKKYLEIDALMESIGYSDNEDKCKALTLFREDQVNVHGPDLDDALNETIECLGQRAALIKQIFEQVAGSGLGSKSFDHVNTNLVKAFRFETSPTTAAYLFGEVIGTLAHTPTIDPKDKDQKENRKQSIHSIYEYIKMALYGIEMFDESITNNPYTAAEEQQVNSETI